MNKPVIGVTGPRKGGTAAWLFTRFAVWRNGGKALRITPGSPRTIESLDGLILGGGADIHPERYGRNNPGISLPDKNEPRTLRSFMITIFSFVFYPFLFLIRKLYSVKPAEVSRERDKLEFALLESAITKNIPILGICRGAQLINVQMGGDLHQNLASFYEEIPRIHSIWPQKKVVIDEGSKLFEILREKVIFVNALHYQAVDNPGKDIDVVGREETGVIQAIEYKDHPFLIGVQWHPEYMPQIECHNRIFARLVEDART